MKDEEKTREQLLSELVELRQRLAEFEEVEAERKRVEEALRESEERYRSIFEQAADSIVLVDAETGALVEFNDRAYEILGYTGEEFEKMKTPDFEVIESAEEVAKHIEKIVKEGTDTFETKHRTKSGEIRDVQVSSRAISVGGRDFVQSIWRDITERKRAERVLRESEEKYHSIFETAANLIISVNEEGIIVDCNSRIREVLGYEQDEITGQPMAKIIHPDYLAKGQDSLMEILTKGFSYNKEYKMVRKDGALIDVSINSARLRDEKGEFVRTICIIHDITERKRMEEEKERAQVQLLQAQRMNAIGILVSGVAHEFNNLLGAIQGYAELAMMQVDEADPLHTDLQKIVRIAERGGNLIDQLLLYGRKHPMEPTLLNLNRTVGHLLEMVNRLIGEDIAINIDLEPDLWTVRADEVSIEQVIMNLVINAREAMPKGGKLAIKTENVTLDEDDCEVIPEARPGKFVCLSVADTGVGMDEEIMQHIFEPFFTTKEVGKGAGLGLSVVYGIVKQHEGWIDVHSEPGQGSMFQIYLPALTIKPEDEIEETIRLQDLQGSGERILLVEDEEDVRGFLTRALGENGYIVLGAANAKEAIDIFEREKGEFHLVFTDVVLPDLDGLQLVDQLLSRNPQLGVLLSSGYTDDRSQWPVIRERGFPFLQKPYALARLLQATRDAMESS